DRFDLSWIKEGCPMAIMHFSPTGASTHCSSSAANGGTIGDDTYYNQPTKQAKAGIEEARRLAYQAGSKVDTLEEKIRWMRLSGVSTDTAEKTLRTMLKIRDQTIARLRLFEGAGA